MRLYSRIYSLLFSSVLFLFLQGDMIHLVNSRIDHYFLKVVIKLNDLICRIDANVKLYVDVGMVKRIPVREPAPCLLQATEEPLNGHLVLLYLCQGTSWSDAYEARVWTTIPGAIVCAVPLYVPMVSALFGFSSGTPRDWSKFPIDLHVKVTSHEIG